MFSPQQHVNSKIMQVLDEWEYIRRSGLKRVIARNGGTTIFLLRSLNTIQSGAKFKIPKGVDFFELIIFSPALTKLVLFDTLDDTFYDNKNLSI